MSKRKKVMMEIWIEGRQRKRVPLEKLIAIPDYPDYRLGLPSPKKGIAGTIKEMNLYWWQKKVLRVICPFCGTHRSAKDLLHWGKCAKPKCSARLYFGYRGSGFVCIAMSEFLEEK